MAKFRPRFERPLYFSFLMVEFVRNRALAGYTSNKDIAEALCLAFDPRITTDNVSQWRRQHREFERACSMALMDVEASAISNIVSAIKEGSVADSWRFLERRNVQFQPKSKLEHSGHVEGLDSVLERRAAHSDEELRKRGVIYEDEEDED